VGRLVSVIAGLVGVSLMAMMCNAVASYMQLSEAESHAAEALHRWSQLGQRKAAAKSVVHGFVLYMVGLARARREGAGEGAGEGRERGGGLGLLQRPRREGGKAATAAAAAALAPPPPLHTRTVHARLHQRYLQPLADSLALWRSKRLGWETLFNPQLRGHLEVLRDDVRDLVQAASRQQQELNDIRSILLAKALLEGAVPPAPGGGSGSGSGGGGVGAAGAAAAAGRPAPPLSSLPVRSATLQTPPGSSSSLL
jgi:hypothetical protein